MTVPTCPTPKLKGLRCQQSLEVSAAPQPLDPFSRMRFIPLCPMSHLKEWHLGTLRSGLHPHPSQRTWSYMLMCAAILTHVACVHTPCEHAKRAQLCPSPRMREVSNEPFPSTGEGAALGDICPTRRHLSNMDYISVTGCHEPGSPTRTCWKTSGRSLSLCWGQLEGGVK